jgi:hypothetical protein
MSKPVRGLVVAAAVLLATFEVGASVTIAAPGVADTAGAADLFQWYGEFDSIDYAGNAPSISRTVPHGRVAVIDFVTFNASEAGCPLSAVTIRTTFRGLGSLHTIVGVVDLGPAQVGRSYGLSQPARVYAGSGQTVTAWVRPTPTSDLKCSGEGLDLTLSGHFVDR